ncbi:hypothetical protein JCM10296v2_004964 [Rhodotorula toruloides]
MQDGRYSWLNMPSGRSAHLLDEEDERLGWDLPDDDIQVPVHLLAPYQDEDDETVLPSQAHPSWPYGNPYKPNLLTSPSRRSKPNSANPSSLFTPSTHAMSLSTSLPTLELRDLFLRTTFGDAADRQWDEMYLPGLFGRRTRLEEEEDDEERDAIHNAHGDAGPPAGQNAADDEDGAGSDVDEGARMDEEGQQDQGHEEIQ